MQVSKAASAKLALSPGALAAAAAAAAGLHLALLAYSIAAAKLLRFSSEAQQGKFVVAPMSTPCWTLNISSAWRSVAKQSPAAPAVNGEADF